ncbi:MAG: hypothetical protein ACR2QS_09640 [Woeseiaceae bacterium]
MSSALRATGTEAGSGSLYLVDLEAQSVLQPIDLNNAKFPWADNGRKRGLRGIAFDEDTMYCVASDALYTFNSAFEFQNSWTNPYLKYCRGLAVFDGKLFIVSSGFDSIIGFDLATQEFDWALQIKSRGAAIGAHPYDPNSDDGPIMVAKLDLREIFCDGTGMYVTGKPGLVRFIGKEISVAAELPPNSHDARPFRDGILFNDGEAGTLRYTGRGEGEEDRTMDAGESARGLCVLNGAIVAGGASPAKVSVYDLAANRQLISVQISDDENTSISAVAVWPFD